MEAVQSMEKSGVQHGQGGLQICKILRCEQMWSHSGHSQTSHDAEVAPLC